MKEGVGSWVGSVARLSWPCNFRLGKLPVTIVISINMLCPHNCFTLDQIEKLCINLILNFTPDQIEKLCINLILNLLCSVSQMHRANQYGSTSTSTAVTEHPLCTWVRNPEKCPMLKYIFQVKACFNCQCARLMSWFKTSNFRNFQT